jgi:hypothetical protein
VSAVAERCPHGYHATEGHCPTCDLDRDGKCGPYCKHDHETARPDPQPANGGECPGCGRIMSWREAWEQGGCNDCTPGVAS